MKTTEEIRDIAMKLAQRIIGEVEQYGEFHFGETEDELDEKDDNGDYLQLEMEGNVSVIEHSDCGTKWAPPSVDYEIETDGVKARVTDMEGNVIVEPFEVEI